MASSKNNQRPMELQRDVTEDLERTRSDIIKQPIHSNAFSTVRFVENKPIKFVAPLRSLSFVKSEQELTELQKRSSDLSRTSSSTIRDLQRISELDKEQQRRTETEKRRDSASRLQRRRTKRMQRRLVAEEEDNKLQNKYNEEDNASGDERFAPECVSLHREASQVEILQKKSGPTAGWQALHALIFWRGLCTCSYLQRMCNTKCCRRLKWNGLFPNKCARLRATKKN